MIKKIRKYGICLLLVLVVGFGMLNSVAFAKIGDSGTVVEEGELSEKLLLNGIKLYEQDLGFYEDGNKSKYNVFSSQYLEMDTTRNDVKVVSWSYRSIDSWKKMGVTEIAKNFEKNNPGWIVVGGANADFFAINDSGEMDYNAMENGEFIKPRNDVAYSLWRGILGFNDDNELIAGRPTITSNYNIHVYEDKTMSNQTSLLEATNVNTTTTNKSGITVGSPISEKGITVITKDALGVYDLTGCKVLVGKYDITRVGYENSSKTVFNYYVKGEIVEEREGTTGEIPEDYRTIDGMSVTTREFYLVAKDDSLDSLKIGDYVKIQKDYTGDFSEVTNSFSYYWKVLENGTELFKGISDSEKLAELQQKYPNGDFSYITVRKARCMFGIKADGSYIMAIIDGGTAVGTTLSEAATYMKEIGCVDAWNLDGGGSATLIARNQYGDIETINTPSDSGGASERAVGNAMLMVIRDPGYTSELGDSTATTVKLVKKSGNDYYDKMQNIKIKVGEQTFEIDNTMSEIVLENLEPGKKYYATVSYTYEGEACSSEIILQTKEYKPGIGFKATSNGFNVTIDATDEILKTINVTIKIGDKTYYIDDTNDLKIKDLFVNTTYDIEYAYTIKNVLTNETYNVDYQKLQLSTLSYQTPVIEYFNEYSLKNNTLKIEYSYEDKESLLSDVYVLVNGVRDDSLDVTKSYGLLIIKKLELDSKKYTYQLVIEYETPNQKLGKEYSDILSYGVDCNHVYDNDCDDTCNLCGYQRTVEHQFTDATCENPKTCTKCGVTEGEALGHNWKNATCENPKTCDRCHATEGEISEHNFENGICTICGKKDESTKKGCKKSSLHLMVISTMIATSLILIFRKRK